MSVPDPNTFSLDINDPEDAELIEYFLGELPEKVDFINDAADRVDLESLRRIAHQLKGAAPGFGFPSIGSAAKELEGRIRELSDSGKDIAGVRAQIESLTSLCLSYISSNPFQK